MPYTVLAKSSWNPKELSPAERIQLAINECQLHRRDALDLSSLDIEIIPPEVFTLTHLRQLYLKNNHINELPPDIANLVELEVLDLSNNLLHILPQEIKYLTKLKELTLQRNLLSSFPTETASLPHLENLQLQYNQILNTEIPLQPFSFQKLKALYLQENNIQNLSGNLIGSMKSLERLYLEGNRLESLPSEIGTLHKLLHLHVRQNALASLPATVGDLAALVSLNISYNAFLVLPKSIAKISNLEELHADSNHVTELHLDAIFSSARNLRVVNLQHNRIRSIPASVGLLSKLISLRVSENPLGDQGVPWKAIADGCPALKHFYVSFAYLTTIPDDALPLLKRLETIKLDGNELQMSKLNLEVGSIIQKSMQAH